MQNCISFTPTLQKSLKSKINVSKWDEATDYFEQKRYHESIYAAFDYIDAAILRHYANPDKSKIVIPQGSAVVIIEISSDTISIRAPFVKLPAEKRLPILRKCTEINFNDMSLPQLYLEDDVLSISYVMPVELCEPYKLYDLLRDIAINADRYDDEFVEKFGAQRVMEPQVSQYPENDAATIRKTAINIVEEALNYAAFFESKRDLVLASDALLIGINRLKYYASPTGMTGSKLNDAVGTFFNRSVDMPGKIKAMRTALEGVKTISDEEFRSAFNITYQLIPLKSNASRNYLQDWIERQYDDASSMLNKGNYATAVSYSLYTLYIILADFNIDENSSKAIEYSLRKAAGKPFQEAAPILVRVLKFFYENEDEEFDMDGDHSETASREDYSQTISNMMDQYKSMLGNFMKAFK